MIRRTLTAALVLGGLSAGSCVVYDKSDLPQAVQGGRSGAAGASRGGGGSMSGGGAGSDSGGAPSLSGGSTGETGGQSGSPGSSEAGSAGELGEAGTDGGGTTQGGTPSSSGGAAAGGGAGGSSGVPAMGGGGGSIGTAGEANWPPELIDDCEDRNNQVLQNGKRNGYWYVVSDGTSKNATPLAPTSSTLEMTELPVADQSAGNQYAFKLVMKGFSSLPPLGWGAGGAFDFVGPKGLYDASAFTGLSFVAKANANKTVEVRIALKATDHDGGVCDPSTSAPSNQQCGNHWLAHRTITTTWTRHEVKWSDFMQDASWGYQTPFNAKEQFSVQFVIPPPGSNDAELWIDDIKFLPAASSSAAP